MYFLALSQAPPPVVMEMATNRPVMMVPMRSPPSACTPKPGPMSQLMTNTSTMGIRMGSSEGMIISLIAALVSMSTARE
jgi:hypothetical protein